MEMKDGIKKTVKSLSPKLCGPIHPMDATAEMKPTLNHSLKLDQSSKGCGFTIFDGRNGNKKAPGRALVIAADRR
ncbi:hypothetical protein [Herbaspirillum hiltneri]|uniref:hypothetical protein n=1 Tax=Herbaspirillum hiltneri TaxID=341045 RepID=UPI0011873A5F|nr:hypothetical protein [Herbaspirillum hiltneri]